MPFALSWYKQHCQPYMYVSSQNLIQTKTIKQKAAYSNPRRQSHGTHWVSTIDHTADIANLPKHINTQQSQQHTNVRPAAPLQSYCRIYSCICKFTNQPHQYVKITNQTIVIAIHVQFVFAAPCAPTTSIQPRQSIDAVRVVMIRTT